MAKRFSNNFRSALVSVACQRFTGDQSSTCRQSQKGSNSATVSRCESKCKIQVHTRTDSIAQQGSEASAALTAQVSAKDFAQEDASDSASLSLDPMMIFRILQSHEGDRGRCRLGNAKESASFKREVRVFCFLHTHMHKTRARTHTHTHTHMRFADARCHFFFEYN